MKQQWYCLSIVLLIGIVRADNSPSDLNGISLNGTVIIPTTIDDELNNGSVNGSDQAPSGNAATEKNDTITTTPESDIVSVEVNGTVTEDVTIDEEPIQLIETQPYGDKDVPFEENFLKFLKENPNEITIMSPGYPQPYSNDTFVKSFEATGGTGVDVTIHVLDINPKTDYLRIHGGEADDDKEHGPMLTGTLTKILKFRFVHTRKFTVEFVPNLSEAIPNVRKGFLITYASQGDVIEPTTTTTTEPTVPAEKLEYISKELEVNQAEQTDATWEKIRNVLSESTNKYLERHNLNYEPARPDRVILVMVQRCPVTWPRSTDCVIVQFGVPLPPKQVEVQGVRRTTTVEPPYELSEASLEAMWTEFAVIGLDQVGLGVYTITESTKILAIWITISLSVIAAFILVLYSIWKIDFMKDYRRMSDSHEDNANNRKPTIEPPPFSIHDYPPPPQDGIDAFMRDYAPNDFNKAYEGTPYSGSGANLSNGENPFAFEQGYTNNNFSQTSLDPYDSAIMDFNDQSPINDFNDGKIRHTYDELSVTSSNSNNNHRLYGSKAPGNSDA